MEGPGAITSAGYGDPAYVVALAEFGTPRQLGMSGGWILERPIVGTGSTDGMGCYPIFACSRWDKLESDLNNLGNDLISVALVADPFGEHDPAYLHRCFPDVCTPFKRHLTVDLSRSPNSFVDAHHRRNARKALDRVRIERVDPETYGEEWNRLYANLIVRHDIRGLAAFSRTSLDRQLKVPGIVVFRATCDDESVGMILWYVDRSVGYYHLGAYTQLGYDLRASFALFWHAIEYFADCGIQWLNLGGGAGAFNAEGKDGLSRFKRGWATDARVAYFCGRIFNRERYEELALMNGAGTSSYFPAYRKGEFA